MEPLPHEPRDFRELVEADLRRAARLPEKHIEPVIAALLPASPRAMTPKEIFGPAGVVRPGRKARGSAHCK